MSVACAEDISGNHWVDLTGQRFGDLTVLELAEGRSKIGSLLWVCLCRCGGRAVIDSAYLRSGNTTHCSGCPRHSRGHGRVLEKWERQAYHKFQTYRVSARKRDLVFDLSRDEFVALAGQPCHYCGASQLPNGVDRVNNERGYVPGNTVPCCKTCNRAKNTMGYDDFLAWLDRAMCFRTQEEV